MAENGPFYLSRLAMTLHYQYLILRQRRHDFEKPFDYDVETKVS